MTRPARDRWHGRLVTGEWLCPPVLKAKPVVSWAGGSQPPEVVEARVWRQVVRWCQKGCGEHPWAVNRHGRTSLAVCWTAQCRGTVPRRMWSGQRLSRRWRSNRLLRWGSSEQLLPVAPTIRVGRKLMGALRLT